LQTLKKTIETGGESEPVGDVKPEKEPCECSLARRGGEKGRGGETHTVPYGKVKWMESPLGKLHKVQETQKLGRGGWATGRARCLSFSGSTRGKKKNTTKTTR